MKYQQTLKKSLNFKTNMKITKEQIQAKKQAALQAALQAEKRNPIIAKDCYVAYELDNKGNCTGKMVTIEKETTQYCYSTNKRKKLF